MEHLGFTLVTFILFTALVGVVSGKIVSGSDNQKTSKGYFLAGNGLGGTFIAGSMLLTNLSAENLVGLSGQSYGANMSGMAWEATAVIATIVMAFVFLPLYLKKGYTTLPEFMEERYGTPIRRMVSILFLIGYLLVGIPVCLYAGAIAFNQIFDLGSIFGISSGTALTILIVLVGIIGALYAVVGGMKAVAVSDTINGVLLVVGSGLVVIFGFIALGKANGGGFTTGVADILNNAPEKLNAIGGKTDPVPFACIFTGMLLANLFYWGTNQVLIQRALGAKNLKEGQKGVLISGLLKMMVPFLLVLPGVIAARLVPGLESNDFAYPTLVARSLPWPIVGLFCAALFGSIISTYNSFLNAASTVFMMDIYKPIFRPDLSEEKTVALAKKVGWGFAVFAIVFTPFLDVLSSGLYDFGRSFTGFYNIPIITLVLVGMFSKRGSSLGAVCATIFHIFLYSGYKFWFKMIDTPITNAICGINYMHIYAISFIVMLVIIFVCSKIAPNERVFDNSMTRSDNYDMTPWKHRSSFAIWLVSFLVYEYFMFSPAGLATHDKNYVLIIGVTAALVIETVVLILKEKKKRA
ncbi:MAG: solute:sodium symporter family transporter [Faecalicatena sp.]|uniref:solute:sodium symporter family transporter n=1 Tax=Faecalicatena sp. TaxID=2005360 RepID=UPI00258A0230|nr:solute:sodium symporter family transporter [Faecalicatena sp.]MCI6467855.1 solute:sodium symporter family transporter [Faecalicatena sp.]MDY5619504.1 solute:sodium symporter family transporter [Lachnospiraceae bacterium]